MIEIETNLLQRKELCDIIPEQEHTLYARVLTVADAHQLERQLVPLLNTLRRIQGKRPLLLPGDRRTG